MKPFCDECDKEVKTKVVHVAKRYYKGGLTLVVDHEEARCLECEAQVYDEVVDGASLKTIWSAFNAIERGGEENARAGSPGTN